MSTAGGLATAAELAQDPRRPEHVLHVFSEALAAGDLRAAVACFTREACMITPDGTQVHGRGAVAGLLNQLIDRSTEIEITQLAIRRAGDVALALGTITMGSDGPRETRYKQSCEPTVVLRRVESEWKVALFTPWGTR